MKKIFIFIVVSFLAIGVSAQNLKPYILAGYSSSSISDVETKVKDGLKSNGFEILGTYHPMGSSKRTLIAVTNSDLKSAVKKVGGFAGFALVQKVALTVENGKVAVSYTNPEYWGRAYFIKSWGKVSGDYTSLAKKYKVALAGFTGNTFSQFGSKSGINASKLKKYHYMMGMPYFDDNIKIGTFSSFAEAVSTIDAKLKTVSGVKKVFSKSAGNVKLYGVALTGKDGEKLFIPKIDVNAAKHTAFLPYELLVVGNKVYMLHGRYRLALSFPDLSMGQFMKIASTPGYINDKFEELCK